MNDNFKTKPYGASRNSGGIGEFEKTHFAEGSVRYAYLGSAKQGDEKSEESEEMAVLKMFKTVENNTIQNWTCDINACFCALQYANKFCELDIYKQQKQLISLKKIEFVFPKVLKLEGHHHHIPCCMQYFCKKSYSFVVIVEPYLSGSYIKFSDNYGYENNSVGNADLLFAFSHWTYVFTNHECMVSDLQGIEMEDKYVLTDPAVHSIKQVYGLTDLGYTGMQKVLNGHTCNNICKSLGLKQLEKNIPAKPEKQGTRLTKELTKDEKKTNAERKKSFKKGGKSNGQFTCSRFFKGSSAVYPTVPKKLNSKTSKLSFTSKTTSHLISKIKDTNPMPVLNLTVIREFEEVDEVEEENTVI